MLLSCCIAKIDMYTVFAQESIPKKTAADGNADGVGGRKTGCSMVLPSLVPEESF